MQLAESDWLSEREQSRLRTIVSGMLIVIGLAVAANAVVAILESTLLGRRLWVLAFAAATVAASAWRLRYSLHQAGIVLTVGLWVLAAFNSVVLAGVYSSGNVMFPFVIVLAGWLMGRRELVVCTLASMLFLAALAVLEMQGLFTPTPRAPAMTTVITYLAVMPVIAFMTWSMRSILVNGRQQTQELLLAQESKALELQQSEAAMQALMENMPAAVASFDMQSQLLRCNSRYAALFGASPQDLVGRNISSYVPQVVLDQIKTPWDLALQGTPQNYRRFNVNPQTAELTWVDSGLVPSYRDGVQVGIDAVLVDVTDKVQADAEIRTLNTQLERRVNVRTEELNQARNALQDSHDELVRSQAKAGLSAMVASVSHELGTPIGNSALVASTFVDLSRKLQSDLEKGTLRKSELASFSEMLIDGSSQLKTNLERAEILLRNFKQVSADQASEQRRTFDLAEVVKEVISSMGPVLKRSPHKVNVKVPQGILMDSLPGPLGQVIINLINNALLHAFEGIAQGEVCIEVSHDEASVQITVSDNGRGMSAEVRARLFQPFFSTKIGSGGTGLGMSIVDTIVRKSLGGAMRVKSEPGHGTRFDIDLPKAAPIFHS